MENLKDKKTDDILEKLVHINRITKVVKGGRRFGFSALVVVGNQAGKIGIAHAKAKQVPDAIKKANEMANAKVEPEKDQISFDDFTKLDIRVGTILEAEKMPKTKKLLKLKVDTGLDVRTIVSGIAESFTAEEVVGKRVSVLVNLAPRALRGVESQGMILMTEDESGNLVFVNPDIEGIDNGLKIS